ncbi:MAG: 4Fe-4S dicluster domain-containing protein [Acidobacteria bacterium]|nr:4Fe-4S dicluster domain-containing protein [Acidobacteriota bacterium]
MSSDRRDFDAEIEAALTDPSIQSAVGPATRAVASMRRKAVADFDGYEAARDRSRAIKERAIERLPELIETVQSAVEMTGGRVHLAEDAAEACRIIVEIARREGCERAVKSKSMTSEEVHLNAALENAGIHVRETDLGEYIAQLDDDRPSHIIAPILHKSLDEVRRTFREGLGLDEVPETPEALTQLARERLRTDFLAADMGITGANFVIADSGALAIVENEGNARLCTQVPRVHVALAGVEKLLPTIHELQPFMELLPRSATGQILSVYLSIITGPGWGGSPLVDGERTFDLVLLDNGRMAMRDDPVLREALYCVRCGACLNVCPPYQAVGGHVFGGETYQSGIGAAWEAGIRGLDAAEFGHMCSTCSRCEEVCPVRIDIPWMNSNIRGRQQDAAPDSDGLMTALLREPRLLYERARSVPGSSWLADLPPVRWYLERSAGLDRRRALPQLPPTTVSDWHVSRGGTVLRAGDPGDRVDFGPQTLVLWADCHTDHVEVPAGQAAVGVLERLGHDVIVATGSCCGRAALSQGDLAGAARQAGELLGLLEPLAEAGLTIVGLEPSCVSCVVTESERLLPDDSGATLIAVRVQDIFEFLTERAGELEALISSAAESADGRQVVLHGHCQQKTEGWLASVEAVLGLLPGVRIDPTTAECCGMAGSYGYKSATYAVSHELGQRLVGEIAQISGERSGRSEVASCGTSCRAQIKELGGATVRHPIELLAEALE